MNTAPRTARTWFAVVRPDDRTPTLYPSREHAEAIASGKRFEYPTLGPWAVVEVVEVPPVAKLAVAA